MPIIRLGRITETPVPRRATTSTKLTPRVSRPRRRCGVAFRIINAATSSGTREPARHPRKRRGVPRHRKGDPTPSAYQGLDFPIRIPGFGGVPIGADGDPTMLLVFVNLAGR